MKSEDGRDAERIVFGSTLSNDRHAGVRFDYLIANPPYGKDWKRDEDEVRAEHERGMGGRFGPGLPRISDGQLLFLLHMLAHRKAPEEGGTRIAIIMNGSPLFTGDAGSGESEIRRWILENDWLEALIALPEQLFYNTGIATYVWVLTNRKAPRRRGLVQLIDATSFWVPMRKSLGDKRREVPPERAAEIVALRRAFAEGEHCKIFPTTHFGFRKITVERPLRLNFQVTPERIARVEEEKAFRNLATSRKKGAAGEAEIELGREQQELILQVLEDFDDAGLYKSRDAFEEVLFGTFREVGVKLAALRRGASPRPIDDPVFFDEGGEYAWVRIADVTASDRYLERTTQRLSEIGMARSVPLQPGELFLSIAGTVGEPIITKIKSCIHDGFVYFVGLRENREFLYYLFSGGEMYKGLGKLGTQLNLNTDTIGDIYTPVPPRDEQATLVDYLDRGTSRIDALIEKKEHLIELLQEKRTALITHAVTKGIDPDVPMKGSGVEWLGEIPAHWDVQKATWLFRVGSGTTPRSEDAFYYDGEIPWVTTSELRETTVTATAKNVSDLALRDYSSLRIHPKGSLVVAMYGATIGRLGILGVDATVNQACCVFGRPRGIDVRFAFYWCQMRRPYLISLGSGGGQPNLSQDLLRSLRIPTPPETEQREIVAFLDRQTAEIDRVRDTIQQAIECLKEYRTALISAAVTGKIDVREEVA